MMHGTMSLKFIHTVRQSVSQCVCQRVGLPFCLSSSQPAIVKYQLLSPFNWMLALVRRKRTVKN